MGLFDIAQDVVVEEEKDTLGSGSFVWNTGVYTAKIVKAYIDKSKNGAISINITLETPEGKKLDITEYVTNREGNNFYVDKRSGKKKLLPGFNKMNTLAKTLTGKQLSELEMEEKMVEVYDFDAGKRLPRPKQVIMDLMDVEGKFGIIKVIDFKNQDKTETKEKNELDKVFNTEGKTLTEITSESDAAFIEEYKKKYTSEFIKDKTKGKAGNTTTKDKPKKSLFD